MKLDRTEIAVLVLILVAIVTVNSYMRVKWGGRHAREMLERQRAAQSHDAGSAEGGTAQTPNAGAPTDAASE